MSRQTMINNLPNPPMDTRTSEQPDAQLVDEIFKGMNEQGLYQRQMDDAINVPQENSLQPTPEQIYQMQQEQQKDMMSPQQIQFLQAQSYPPTQAQLQESSMGLKPSIGGVTQPKHFDLVTFVKSISLFAFLFLILSAPFVSNLMTKIPFFAILGESGVASLSTSGLLVKALLGGIIFAGLQYFL